MTYYVMSDMGIEEEFNNFEEADNYIDANGDPSTLWIATDEDDFEPSYNEDEGFDPYMGDYSWDCQSQPLKRFFNNYNQIFCIRSAQCKIQKN